MPLLARVVSLAVLFALVAAAALPWGVEGGPAHALPLLPVAAIAVWGSRPELIPAWAVLVAGIVFDCLTFGPLGAWALIWLAALVTSRVTPTFAPRLLRIALACALTLSASTLFRWVLASTSELPWTNWHQHAVAALWAFPVCFVLAWALSDLPFGHPDPATQRLQRGT